MGNMEKRGEGKKGKQHALFRAVILFRQSKLRFHDGLHREPTGWISQQTSEALNRLLEIIIIKERTVNFSLSFRLLISLK
jgi:hypothetical protein